MPTWLYFSRASNMTMHDLTTLQKPPSNLKCLLGLNLKFIPRRRFTTHELDDTLQRFRQQVYLQHYYLNNPSDDSDTNTNEKSHQYNRKLHIPTHWVPAKWKITEDTIYHTDNFISSIKKLFYKWQCTPNLSLTQLNLLKTLRKKDKFIIVKADKNLGPCILETERYIQFALDDHLKCRNTYRKITLPSANTHMDSVRKKNKQISLPTSEMLTKRIHLLYSQKNKRM